MFAREFTASLSGWVFYLFAIYTFVVYSAGFSLESGIGFYSARREVSDSRLLTILFCWSVFAGILLLVALLVIRFIAPQHFSYPLSYPLGFVLGNMLINFGNAFCYSKFKFRIPATVAIAVNGALVLLLVIRSFGVTLPFNFISLYFYSFLIQGIILFVIIIRTTTALSFEFSRHDLQKVLKYSSVAFSANFLGLILNRIDYLFVKVYCSATDLGNYIQVAKIGQVFFLLPSILASVLFPVIASGKQPAIVKEIRSLSSKLFIGYGGVCLLIALCGYWLFPLVYGETFGGMYAAFLFYVPGILAMSSLYPYTVYFGGVNRVTVNLTGTAIAVLVTLAGDVLLIPRYGINAAALVSSISYITYMVYVVSVFKKQSR